MLNLGTNLRIRAKKSKLLSNEVALARKYSSEYLVFRALIRTFAPAKQKCTRKTKMGKSHTACSLGIPQDLTVARVLGCSGAMW